jgi:lysophospholipase
MKVFHQIVAQLLVTFVATTPLPMVDDSTTIIDHYPGLAKRSAQVSNFAPRKIECPGNVDQVGLIRTARQELGKGEDLYIEERRPKAAMALLQWLEKINGWQNFKTDQMLPQLALVNSGGGYRAFLTGAGIVKGLDSRENMSDTSGLYQALNYHSGLSGGAWLLSSLAASDWQTVSFLAGKLWKPNFENGLLSPGGSIQPLLNGAQILQDVIQKDDAGFDPTLTDTWSRLLSYQMFEGGINDQNQNTLSSITQKSSFQNHDVPYPIMTAVLVPGGQCEAPRSSPMVEMSPYEWGSWEPGVNAFTDTTYLGSKVNQGVSVDNECVVGYDNLGFIMGTSSNVFTEACAHSMGQIDMTNITKIMAEATLGNGNVHLGDTSMPHRDLFATYPNPFGGYPESPQVADLSELRLTDGGLSDQNCPIWPFIQPARKATVDVLIVSDNSANEESFPDGSQIYNTYEQAMMYNYTRMPEIPIPAIFVAKKYNKAATFFGCYEPNALTIIYLPNVEYSFPSNQSTLRLDYSPDETEGMIRNGVDIVRQGGQTGWGFCIGCAVMAKVETQLPASCKKCFDLYCYKPTNATIVEPMGP